MNKKVCAGIICLALLVTSVFAGFRDVSKDNKYYKDIEYVENCGIFEGEDNDCRIQHSIELVVREDMSLAVLTCCETVIGDCEYCSAYRELKEEWPTNVASIDLEKLHKRLMSLIAGYEDGQDVFFEP